MDEIDGETITYGQFELQVEEDIEEWRRRFQSVTDRRDALIQRLGELAERSRKLPKGAVAPNMAMTESDMKRAVERKWRRKNGQPLSDDEAREKARALELSLQFFRESRALHAEFEELRAEMKDLEIGYAKWSRHFHFAQRVFAKEAGDAEAVREVNRMERRKRRARR